MIERVEECWGSWRRAEVERVVRTGWLGQLRLSERAGMVMGGGWKGGVGGECGGTRCRAWL
jgi:hypothetical protein